MTRESKKKKKNPTLSPWSLTFFFFGLVGPELKITRESTWQPTFWLEDVA